MGSMITVHHLENSRSQRILWLLEELELDYELKTYARDPKTSLAPPELAAVHPLGKSPVITDGDVTMAESGAIVEYLLATHGQGKLRPEPGTEAFRRYLFWMHYAEGSLMPYLTMKLVFQRVAAAPVPFFLKPVTRGIAKKTNDSYLNVNLAKHVAYLEAELGSRPWFTGDELTGADIQMSFPVDALTARGRATFEMPALLAWIDKVKARPAYRRAEERGGTVEILSG